MTASADLFAISDKLKRVFQGKGDKNKSLLKKMGLAAVDIVVTRTRKGFGVKKTGGNRKKLKALSKGYIARRKMSNLHRTTSPRKSNLTFTGQMLESVKVLRSTKKSSFSIGPSGRRSDGKRNADVGRWVSDQGRPFMNLGRLEIKELSKIMRSQMKDRLQKI